MKISIIIPTKNEGTVLGNCLNSIRNLDYEKDNIEVIIVDGHSNDNTVEIAEMYDCKVVYENIGSRGGACNVGLRNAEGELVAFTDADCIVPKDWLKNIIKEFKDEKIASVGGPNVTPDNDTDFAKCVGTVLVFLSKPGARYGFNIDRVTEVFHNPGCNVAYIKNTILKVGCFNENLTTCEDEELDYRIRKRGYKILFTPNAKVLHYRRPTWDRFRKMAYRYGIGRMQAIRLHRHMGKWFHYIPPSLISLILLFFILSFINFLFPLIALFILTGGALGIAIMSIYLARKKMKNILNYFGLILTWFLGYGLGMLRGILK